MRSLKEYIFEGSASEYCMHYVHGDMNDVMTTPSLDRCYDALKHASDLKYYDITKGNDTSDVKNLIEWAGEGGYWANMANSDSRDAKRWHDQIMKKQKDLNW